MKKKLLFLFVLIPLIATCQKDLKLWYEQPARNWTDAMPAGNGRLGAMIFGKEEDELIQLNESTLWSGGPVTDKVNQDAPTFLPFIRNALIEGDYKKATDLCKKMQGVYSESYLPLGDLMIKQDFNTRSSENYYRDLNISNAVAKTQFKRDGVIFTREIFSSAPDQIIVIRLSADQPNELNLKVSTKSSLQYINSVADTNVLLMKGVAPAHVDPSYTKYDRMPVRYQDFADNCKGMRFELLTKALHTGGTIYIDTSGITIKNASEIILLLSAATSFNGFDKCPVSEGKDENEIAQRYLKTAALKSYQTLLANHIADYQRFFNRVSLILKNRIEHREAPIPTDKRLAAYSSGKHDPGLEALYFQYGRYLLISSSRPGGIPTNLQGIWNNNIRPPWSSNFTTNINLQMNYWPAEVTNLSEMCDPLFKFMENLFVTGKKTAKEFYGLNGWVVHHNSDIWALSNPVGDLGKGDPKWANWMMGANWLCRHLWDHYLFTRNKNFLRDKAYPLMKGAITFTLGWLIQDKDGYLVTAPSSSPENSFIDEKGNVASIAIASTMDMSIIRDLFSNFIKASRLLNADISLRDIVIKKEKMLLPFHIGKRGNIQEWYKDWDDVEVHHRHISHLFGLFPGDQISPITTPGLARAAKTTLDIRGDEGTGWSKAWKINFWARLLDGNHAYVLLRQLLNLTEESATNYTNRGGTYPNLFDAHPPFQIDGNFGGASGIAEMLLLSEMGEVYLLPALPDEWISGEVKGLKTRGSFEVNISWQNHKLVKASIKSLCGGQCKLRTNNSIKIAGIRAASQKTSVGYVMTFKTEKGKTYQIYESK